jgi:putative ABC transport system permease protein
VAAIGPMVAEVLFGKGPAVGEYIQIRGSSYRVVGIYDDPGGEEEQRFIYIPLSVVQLLNGASSNLQTLAFTVADSDPATGDRLVTEVRRMLAAHHHFSTDDPRAVRFFNSLEISGKVRRMFVWIRVFVWLVGIGTLLAGIVGVSNIMLISVKERTKEIGLRKAIGATPGAIVRMIVGESLVLTSVAGYLGLAGGIGAIALVARVVPPGKGLGEPTVDFDVALAATAVIVLAGVLAGLFPARQAAAIQPIQALRSE